MRLPFGKDPETSGGTSNGVPSLPLGPGLARFWLAGFLGVALVLLLAVGLGVHLWLSREEAVAGQLLSTAAEATARSIASRIAAMRGLLHDWANDPALQQALRSRDEAGMRAKEEAMKRQIPEALGVQLVVPNQAGIMEGRGPFRSDAALDLMGRAFQERKILALEVHRVAQPDMHLAIAGPVLDPQGAEALGVVHLTLPFALLPQVADLGGEAGQILYQQSVGNDLVTLTMGQAWRLPDTAPAGFVAISGTTLRIAIWPRRVGLFDSSAVLWAVIGYLGALALVALALWLPYRRLERALAEDHAGLAALVEDAVMRQPLERIKCRLAETDLLQVRLLQLLHTGGPAGAPAPGSRKSQAPLPGREAPVRPAGQDAPLSETPSAGGYVVVAGAAPPPMPARTSTPAAAGTEPSRGGDLAAELAEGYAEIFRTSDIRGVVGQDIDEAVMRAIGHAVGSEASDLGDRSVIVARDNRESGGALAAALIAGLQASGRNVFDLGVAPTPLLYFATRYQGDASGVMVTGGHQSSEYNGCRIVLRGQSVEGDQLKMIAQRIQRGDLAERPNGGYWTQDLTAAYIDQVERNVTVARGLKLVVDCGNGAAAHLAPALYRALGCEVFDLHCDSEGGFRNGQVPDPSQAENLHDLSGAVTAKGADLGLAFDGDGDRLGVVDSSGRFIAMDRVMMLFAADVLSRYPGTDVIYDVKCTHLLAAEILRSGGRPVMWQSGHSRLRAKLRETGALLAGALSGHVIFQERWFGFSDAIYAGARLLELLALDSRCTADVFAALPDVTGTPELFLPLQEGEPQRIVAQVLALAGRLDGVTVNTVDGLRADFDRGWGLVRACNTRPALSFRFQGDDAESLDMIQGLFRRLMERVAPDLVLPF